MTANSRRWLGFVSTFAPTSSSSVCPFELGTMAASAGRLTPSIIPMTTRAEVHAAPVLPADTNACALPSATRFAQTRMDEFRSEEHTSELQSRLHLVCRLLLEKKK